METTPPIGRSATDPIRAAIQEALRPVFAAQTEEITVSVIVPAHNEAGNLPLLHTALSRQLRPHGNYEIIIVDDGSTDGTLATAKQIAAADPCVHYVALSRNFGHQAAVRAGLDQARGACVISMDADFQHPPELIPQLIEQWHAGFEVVTTVRNDGPETPRLKRVTASLFYWLAGQISEFPIKPGAADFRLLDRKVVDAIRGLGETDFFLRGLIPWIGFKATDVHYRPQARHHGETSYSIKRMISLALTGITATSIQPLRAATVLAGIVATLTLIYAVYAAAVFLLAGTAVPGWTSVIIVISALGALQLLILGIVGEYLGRILRETRHRPSYIVRETNITEGEA